MDTKKPKVKKQNLLLLEERIQNIEEHISYLEKKLDKVLVRMGL